MKAALGMEFSRAIDVCVIDRIASLLQPENPSRDIVWVLDCENEAREPRVWSVGTSRIPRDWSDNDALNGNLAEGDRLWEADWLRVTAELQEASGLGT
jgi:hypothetical protein